LTFWVISFYGIWVYVHFVSGKRRRKEEGRKEGGNWGWGREGRRGVGGGRGADG
jgi:hypothetical protein